MKRLLAILLVGLVVLGGCSKSNGTEKQEIKVYTRDSSSGTRGAFEEIIGIKGKLSSSAAEASANGDMAKKVGSTRGSIGYVSLSTDFEANGIKAVSYEGVMPSNASVLDGTYTLARPFVYVSRAAGDFESDEKEQLVAAFIDYLINSIEGRQVVLAAGGIVDTTEAKAWSELKGNHPIVDQDNSAITLKTAGSTSVEKTLVAAMEQFIPMAGNFKFQPGQTGSGDGYKRVLGGEKDGANGADIGFASRAFEANEEVSKGLFHGEYAKDAVVIVVPKDSAVTNLTKQNLADIFTGAITDWSEIK